MVEWQMVKWLIGQIDHLTRSVVSKFYERTDCQKNKKTAAA